MENVAYCGCGSDNRKKQRWLNRRPHRTPHGVLALAPHISASYGVRGYNHINVLTDINVIVFVRYED